MKRKSETFFSLTFRVGIGMVITGTLTLDGDRASAQSIRRGNRLPPPPSVKQPTRKSDGGGRSICSPCRSPILPPPPPAASTPVTRGEYVFQAPYPVRPATATKPRRATPAARVQRPSTQPVAIQPRRSPVPAPRTSNEPPERRRVISSNQLFRVQVTGTNESTLARVKEIEPLAFIRPGESVIQAGLFQQQQEAKERVRALTSLGFTARIVTLNDR
jgi:hypothetical protein